MISTRNHIKQAAIHASLLVALATLSVGALAQTKEDTKAIAAARTTYSSTVTKINGDYKAAAGKCASMSGADKSVCLIDARAERSKARVDAAAARDKEYARANISTHNLMQEELARPSGGGGGD